MRDHHPSWASPQNDLGALPAGLPLGHLTLILARSPQVQQDFEQFLASQQDPASSEYHHWLTPVEVGERFGVSPQDVAAVSDWLRSQGLHVDSISNSRVRLTFSGPAAAVGKAFAAEMHYYNVNGKQRFSIAAEPQVPAALAPVIRVIHGLYTIEDHPAHKSEVGYFSADGAHPNLSLSSGTQFIAPADFNIIYDLNSGYDVIGQTIAIIGRARVYNPDIGNFVQLTGVFALQPPTVIVPPNGVDPGPAASSGGASADQAEATLDVTRAGSVAPGATILLVVSASAGGGIRTAAEYVADTTPVPAQVMSISFGNCEANAGQAGVTFWDNLFSQAAAEGISSFVSSGDSGAAGCDDQFQTPPASQTASPNYICSSSYATCVGGTEFADFANPSQYWGSNSGLGSALSYIPEGGWNEPTNSEGGFQAAASGGGVSAFIPTPSWQTGPGVPAARAGRYTPDVAFSASAHDGYFACLAAENAGCVVQNGGFQFVSFSGTSAAAPDMAGIAAILNQGQGVALGNLNSALYQLAATTSNVFHDVTVASSGVAHCDVNTPSMCNNSTPSPTGLTGGLVGYVVGTGYDEVTGLGSLDVTNFLTAWVSVAPNPTTTSLTVNIDPNYVVLTATVKAADRGFPTGTVTFFDGTTELRSLSLASGIAGIQIDPLALGTHSLTAVYSGDARYLGSTSPVVKEVIGPPPPPPPPTWFLTVLSTNPSSFASIAVSPPDNNGLSSGSTPFMLSYNVGSVVSLEPAASAGGSNFSSWTGCDSVAGTTCTVSTDRVVTANYGGLSPLPLRFVPLAPCRVVDTRNPNAGPFGFGGPTIAGHSSRHFWILNSPCLAGVPVTVAAYSLNVTAIPDTNFLGYLTIWPTGGPPPLVSTLNSYDGRIKANAAIVPAGAGGAVSVYVTDSTDVVLDINGYFVPADQNSSALAFFPLTPCRVADTRPGNPSGPLPPPLGPPSLGAQQTRAFPVLSSPCNIPTDGSAKAYSLNVTASPKGSLGFLTAWPFGAAFPNASTLNAPTGTLTANAAIVPAGTNGELYVYVTDASDVFIDINGYFAPSTPSKPGLSLYALPPCRVMDTRQDSPGFVNTLLVDTTASPCGIIPNAQAVVLNATVDPIQSLGFLSLWPAGQPFPVVSTLNAQDKQLTSNMAIVPTGTGTSSGMIDAYATDPTQLWLDTSGYFASGTGP